MHRIEILEDLIFNIDHKTLSGAVWTIVDAARDEQIYGYLSRSPAQNYCLYDGDTTDLFDVAPYLVPLAPGLDITHWVLDHWGKSWGIFLRCGRSLNTLIMHLRQHTFVYNEKKERFYFRYYDPRVLRILLPTLDAAKIEAFFGPVTHFLAENHAADALLSYSRSQGRLEQVALPLKNNAFWQQT